MWQISVGFRLPGWSSCGDPQTAKGCARRAGTTSHQQCGTAARHRISHGPYQVCTAAPALAVELSGQQNVTMLWAHSEINAFTEEIKRDVLRVRCVTRKDLRETDALGKDSRDAQKGAALSNKEEYQNYKLTTGEEQKRQKPSYSSSVYSEQINELFHILSQD